MSKLGDELLVLIGREDSGDYNRAIDIVDVLHRTAQIDVLDCEALEKSKPYIREMQLLLSKGQN